MDVDCWPLLGAPPVPLTGQDFRLHSVCSQAPRLGWALLHDPHNLVGWTTGRPLKRLYCNLGVGLTANDGCPREGER